MPIDAVNVAPGKFGLVQLEDSVNLGKLDDDVQSKLDQCLLPTTFVPTSR